MILCVTPNPAIDRTLIVPGFTVGEVFRANQAIAVAGGKGLNVARAAQVLGSDAMCAGFLGGYKGRLLEDLAQREGLKAAWTWIEPETRTCVIVVDPKQNEVTTIYERGSEVSAANWASLQATIRQEAAHVRFIGISGSLPPGPPIEVFGQFVQELAQTASPVWVDTSGDSLRAAVMAKPAGIKVNGEEAGALLNRTIDTVEAALDAAIDIQRTGPVAVVLTMGAQGAVMVSGGEKWWAASPPVSAVSAVGSGDCFFAGLLTGLLNDCPPSEALRQAVAAGTANTLSPGGGRFSMSDYHNILSTIVPRAMTN